VDAPKSPTTSGFADDEDLSHLLSAVSDEDLPEGENDPQSSSPDRNLNDLLEVIERETIPTAQAGPRAATAPEAMLGEDVPRSRRPAEPGLTDESEIVGRAIDDPARESAASIGHEATAGKVAADRTSQTGSEDTLEDTLSAGLTEAITDSTEGSADPGGSTSSLTAWWVYLQVPGTLVANALDRAGDALDRLHPRARDGVGVAGIALAALAFGLILAQLLGWI
jgi:hypothetical protein